jgi:hypothetical protein
MERLILKHLPQRLPQLGDLALAVDQCGVQTLVLPLE